MYTTKYIVHSISDISSSFSDELDFCPSSLSLSLIVNFFFSTILRRMMLNYRSVQDDKIYSYHDELFVLE